MNKKQENKHWFDQWAETYDCFVFRRWMWYLQDKTIAEIPRTAKNILEIGCGTGIGTEKLAKQFPHSTIIAVDLSPNMIHKARQRLKTYKNIQLRVADVEHLPFKKRFDTVFTTEAFHHFPKPLKALKEMQRVTNKKGTIIVTDIYFQPHVLANILFKLEPGFVHLYSRKEMRALFSTARISVVQQKRTGLFALLTQGTV